MYLLLLREPLALSAAIPPAPRTGPSRKPAAWYGEEVALADHVCFENGFIMYGKGLITVD